MPSFEKIELGIEGKTDVQGRTKKGKVWGLYKLQDGVLEWIDL
jgi:hypothetical protein